MMAIQARSVYQFETPELVGTLRRAVSSRSKG